MMHDRIVLSVRGKTVQENLLREDKLDFYKVIKYCRITEVRKTKAKVLQAEVGVNAKRQKEQKVRKPENLERK